MAQTLGTAIEQLAAVGTSPPVAASFPSKSAADSTARQPRTPASTAPAASAAVSAAAASEELSPAAAALAVIETINAGFLTAGKSLRLSVDAASNRSIVILRDTATGTVIGQFPTEEVLRLQGLLSSDPHALIDLTA